MLTPAWRLNVKRIPPGHAPFRFQLCRLVLLLHIHICTERAQPAPQIPRWISHRWVFSSFPPVFTLPTPFQAAPMRPGSEEQALPVARISHHSNTGGEGPRGASLLQRDATRPPGKSELRAPDGTNQRFPQPTLRSLPGTGNH
ncbi:hypothetical protein GDO81_024926 [Engystomops pustulosus]|uniref:Secreted protein n=1 Tax=Engystomops pustulosus TaxID=76066 RepID=A0AAV6YQS4_ENGPU|nr:hypothetical protein GDO81_024926 [Engystomops pustulosus]